MAMIRPRPYWATLAFGAGLVLLFLGQRAMAGLGPAGSLTSLGLLLVFGATALRGWLLAIAPGKLKAVERLLLVCQLGALASLGLYWLGTDSGAKLLGIVDAKAQARWHTIVSVLWPIGMAIALVPLYMIELSIGKVRFDAARMRSYLDQAARETGREDLVELQKVREFATNGLTIALAASFLMVTCNVADQRDVRKDVSYFKTSAPGSATVAMASSVNEPIQVYLFFPEVNQVADEIEGYFKQLAAAAGESKVAVERLDRLVAPTLVKEFKVSSDGTIIVKKGDQHERINVSTDFAKSRREELREIDSRVQQALMKVIRAKRVAYFSVGHGELNDPESAGPMEMASTAKGGLIKKLLGLLNYQVKDWDGFGRAVPDDASILFVLGPKNLLGEEELAAIDAYLARGGSLFLALRPGEPFDLGPLKARLGVAFNSTQIADDKEFRVRRNSPADRLDLVTNQFSSHASVTTLNRVGVRYGVLMTDAGHLLDLPGATGTSLKKTFVVRSMSSAFPDANGNFEHDDDEKRDRYNLVAAVEDPEAKPAKPIEGQADDGMRAMIFSTAAVLADDVLIDRRLGLNQALVVDAVKWLGGEEEFAGETVSEKDVEIEHTKSEDVVWFYASLVGAPFLVLAFGLGGVMWRRRSAQRRRS